MTKEPNVRELALGVLLSIESGEEYSHIAIRSVLEKYQYLGKQERSFLTRLTEGTLERRIWLDYVINQFSSVPVRKQKPIIREILRMSVYQLEFMDSVPDSAVCNEAVKLAQKKGFGQLKGFVNGVLRNIARHRKEIDSPSPDQPVPYLSVRYSMPEWIVEDWLDVYGRDLTEKMLAAFLEDKSLTIRVNGSRTTPEKLQKALESRGIRAERAPYLANALRLSHYDYLAALPEFQQGLFQVQDISSMLAVEAAGVKPGDFCMDVCAAPGGKSLYLAEKTGAAGKVDARDLTEYKAQMIRDNALRMGAENLEVSVKDACVTDRESLERADVLLADLPCSGLGVLGKKTDLKYRMSREQQKELSVLQRKILSTVQSYVKPGGILVYSTCTINRDENQENFRWFQENFPFQPVSMDDCIPKELSSDTTARGYLQLLPGIHECDGFFIAKLRKKKEEQEGENDGTC